MRRALRWLALATFVLAALAGAAGLASNGTAPAMATAHVVLAHPAALAGCLAASVAFVLGLQGLLEGSGRRAGGVVLFVLGPVLMAVSLMAEISGLVAARNDMAGDPEAMAALSQRHAWEGGVFVAAAAVALAAALVIARPDRPRPED